MHNVCTVHMYDLDCAPGIGQGVWRFLSGRVFGVGRPDDGSMSRRGNPNDNAESFFKTLKVEAVEPADYRTFDDVAADIPRFIEQVYNETRLHSAIGDLSPAQFEDINIPASTKSAA